MSESTNGPGGGEGAKVPPPSARALTRHQFDEVMRRASELAAQEVEGEGSAIDESEVFRIAREVGLDEKHVRSALGEVRSSAPMATAGGEEVTFFDRLYGPAIVRTSRVIGGTPRELGRKIDEYMVAGRLLQRVRRGPVVMQYRPSVDWMSQIARAASGTARRYYLASAKSVEVRLHQIDENNVQVEFLVDPGIQGEYAAGGVMGSIFGGGAAAIGTAGASLAVLPEVGALAVGAGVVTAVTAAVTKLTRHYYRKKWAEVLAEIEGVLDLLEMGEDLQPPPSSWRKWVERQFHGARKLLDMDGDGDPDDPWGMGGGKT